MADTSLSVPCPQWFFNTKMRETLTADNSLRILCQSYKVTDIVEWTKGFMLREFVSLCTKMFGSTTCQKNDNTSLNNFGQHLG